MLLPDADGSYLRELLGVDFTDDQLAIATHDLCPQLVVAGAGSGKTMVMAARVVHAVAYQGVAPGRILGLTFTNKAAGELAARVRTSLDKLRRSTPTSGVGAATSDPSDSDLDGGDLPTVSTYHSYAAGVVRDHALRIGREPYTALLTEATQWQLAMRVVRSAAGPVWRNDCCCRRCSAVAIPSLQSVTRTRRSTAGAARPSATCCASAHTSRAATVPPWPRSR